jgi:hypothetical protein
MIAPPFTNLSVARIARQRYRDGRPRNQRGSAMLKRSLVAGVAGAMVALAAVAGPDRVEYPENWERTYTYVTTRDMHRGGNTIVDIFANDIAIQSGGGEGPLASGAKIVMKGTRAKLDANGQPLYDANGRMIKDTASGAITVMEKRAGWGALYPENMRNGDWEFAVFAADKNRSNASTQSCFECHGALPEFDFVFTRIEISEAKR